jgi:hypothetical protein
MSGRKCTEYWSIKLIACITGRNFVIVEDGHVLVRHLLQCYITNISSMFNRSQLAVFPLIEKNLAFKKYVEHSKFSQINLKEKTKFLMEAAEMAVRGTASKRKLFGSENKRNSIQNNNDDMA